MELTSLIESVGKHWASGIKKTRLILWDGKWTQAQLIDEHLKQSHPESFRQWWNLSRFC